MHLRISEQGHGGQDAAAAVTVETLHALVQAADPPPPLLLPDGKWSPAAYAVIEQVRAALRALDDHKDVHAAFAIREWIRTHVGRSAA